MEKITLICYTIEKVRKASDKNKKKYFSDHLKLIAQEISFQIDKIDYSNIIFNNVIISFYIIILLYPLH